MNEVWIIDSCRTPRAIAKQGKSKLSGLHPHELAATVLKAIVSRNSLDSSQIGDVIWGTSSQRGQQSACLARMSALLAGYSTDVPGVTLDRFCGSGISSVGLAASLIASGSEDLLVAGGSEMMSNFGHHGNIPSAILDNGDLYLRQLHPQPHQGLCADLIATLEGIPRYALDQLALKSQKNAAIALDNGYFMKSIVPILNEQGDVLIAKDDYPRPQTDLESLSNIKPAFTELLDKSLDESGLTFRSLLDKKYPGIDISHVHHAGNSSGVVDGAAALLLASPAYAKANGLKPRAKILAYTTVGDCPTLMLNGPIPAAIKVLNKSGLTFDDIDLFEINEAFAVVVEKFIRDSGIEREKVNVNGGSIALGHPIGATGTILIGTLLDELERRNLSRGLATMCTAGGMAPAIIIERC